MSDWQVGDLAVCVDAEPQAGDFIRDSQLRVGSVYTVTRVLLSGGRGDRTAIGLSLLGMRPAGGREGYCEDRFRKIRPDEHEACEPEFVTLLKRTKVRA
jgi:hypothetical protein